jgi:uncharacterized protein YebE (UPF0316 family)
MKGTFPLLRNCGERERLRERGFGVTNYEWVKGALGTRLMVALTRRGNFALPPILKTFISLA